MGRKEVTTTPAPSLNDSMLSNLEQKMDKMMEMVSGFEERIRLQEERNPAQMSLVLSAHSSLRGEGNN